MQAYNPDHWPHGFTGGPGLKAKPTYEIKRSPRGSVVISGARLVTDEMSTASAAVAATWLNRGLLTEQQLEQFEWTTHSHP